MGDAGDADFEGGHRSVDCYSVVKEPHKHTNALQFISNTRRGV